MQTYLYLLRMREEPRYDRDVQYRKYSVDDNLHRPQTETWNGPLPIGQGEIYMMPYISSQNKGERSESLKLEKGERQFERYNSEPNKRTYSRSSQKQKQKEAERNCIICLNNKSQEEFVALRCGHSFCQQCFYEFLTEQMKQWKQIKCLNEACSTVVEPYDPIIASFLSDDEILKYERICRMAATYKNPDLRLCPQESCEGFLDVKQKPMVCSMCGLAFCCKCLLIEHEGECQNVEQDFLKSKYKKCTRCKRFIEKNKGCNHMTCLCKYEFCYKCELPFTNDHYCQNSSSDSDDDGMNFNQNMREIIVELMRRHPIEVEEFQMERGLRPVPLRINNLFRHGLMDLELGPRPQMVEIIQREVQAVAEPPQMMNYQIVHAVRPDNAIERIDANNSAVNVRNMDQQPDNSLPKNAQEVKTTNIFYWLMPCITLKRNDVLYDNFYCTSLQAILIMLFFPIDIAFLMVNFAVYLVFLLLRSVFYRAPYMYYYNYSLSQKLSWHVFLFVGVLLMSPYKDFQYQLSQIPPYRIRPFLISSKIHDCLIK